MKNLKIGENIVYFDSDGKKLEGLLYIPQDYKEGQKRPAMAIARPATGVKEQTASLYAKKFAEKGFITLAFDPKGYGGSEGVPQVEDPISVISDNRNAYSYLETLPQVDKDKLIGTGICMGVGHATAASSDDKRIKAVVGISPYLTAHIDYPKAFGGKAVTKTFIALTKPLVNLLKQIGVYVFIPLVPLRKWMKMMPTAEVQNGMTQYYGYEGKPGYTPSWKNKGNLYRVGDMMTGNYNPFDYISKYINKPFFMAYADGGYSPDKLRQFYDEIPADNKDLLVCPNSGHFDLYYKPEFVTPIVENATKFLNENSLNP